jgi:DNA-binding response OmpR family regulator
MAKKRILIVEDDAGVRRLMRAHFEKNGFAVEYAMAAEEVASDETYDVVLTDVNLPGESGVDLARRIRAHQPDQPVVFMTGDVDAALAHRALRTGAAGYLTKPFELRELDAVISKAVRARPPVQDFGPPVFVHKHFSRPVRILLSPRASRPEDRTAERLRFAVAIVIILAAAFSAGAAI